MASTILYFLNVNSGVIQAVSTVVLVAITLFYALQTKNAVKEAINARLDARLPLIEPLEMRGPIKDSDLGETLELHIANIGYGPALDVRLVLPDGESHDIDNLPEGEKRWYQIVLKEGEASKIATLPNINKTLYIKYYDVFGREIVTWALLNVKNYSNASQSWFDFSIGAWHLLIPNDRSKGLSLPASLIEDLLHTQEQDKDKSSV